MTIFEEQLFKSLAEDFIGQVQTAIRTKPIKRKTQSKGDFESVANASGQLADSLRLEITENEINVYSLAYIESLIYGKPPGPVDSSVFDIENWMINKGIEYSAVSIMENLQKFGNSIFQKFQGAESNFLEDVNITDHVQKVKEQLITKKINEIIYANSSDN